MMQEGVMYKQYSGAGANAPCKPASRIVSALSTQEAAVVQLAQLVDALRARLYCVLSPQPEKEAVGVGTTEPMSDNIAARIDSNTDVVGVAVTKLNGILDALDL